MKEVEKKDAPEISGGGSGSYVTDPPLVGIDYPKEPTSPDSQDQGERDLPTWRN